MIIKKFVVAVPYLNRSVGEGFVRIACQAVNSGDAIETVTKYIQSPNFSQTEKPADFMRWNGWPHVESESHDLVSDELVERIVSLYTPSRTYCGCVCRQAA